MTASLAALAWIVSPKHMQMHMVLPAQVLMMLLGCIIDNTAATSACKDEALSEKACSGLLANLQIQESQAQRLLGYLQLLGVLVLVQQDNDQGKSCHPFFQLSYGVSLRDQTSSPPNSSPWIMEFLRRLEENLEQTILHNKKSHDALSLFYWRHLPGLIIRLGGYKSCHRLLHDNLDYARARLHHLGLEATVKAYVVEWQCLQHSMQVALVSLPPPPATTKTWLCEQVLSMAANHLALPKQQITTKQPQPQPQPQPQEIAKACFTLATFTPEGNNNQPLATTLQLLQLGRLLQLTVLDGHCRRVAKAIHNLGITRHVRSSSKKQKGGMETAHETAQAETVTCTAEPKPLSKQCFDLSAHLLQDL
ncbi:expressed unknown protein [Seminavis robusta]|uniref:Uncharacterized protein n=1 Tax=Seminavis robusta TaxID=568900 RepID=A0A9N8DI73_9STRA|nr:expressed unknown protein [Seminavis robusta]|eukprot:Sro77_g042000.1 n/a (364) ;mRNA; r:49697-50788